MKRLGQALLRTSWVLLCSRVFWLGAAVMVSGLWAFGEQWYRESRSNPETRASFPPLDQIAYKTFQLFTMESGLESNYNSPALVLVRILTCLFVIVTAFHILTAIFRDAFDSFRLQLLSKHRIICGFGIIGRQLTQDLTRRWKDRRWWFPLATWLFPGVVVIEQEESHSDVERMRLRGGLVVTADATDEEILDSVGLQHAKTIFITTGLDASNIEIAFDCINLLRRDMAANANARKSPLECFVQISDPTVRDVFRTRCEMAAKGLAMRVRDFNPASNCGRKLISGALRHERPQSRPETALYVFIGFGQGGQSMALQVAELAHFENRKRARFLIVDADCEATASRFTAQFGAFTHGQCFVSHYDAIRFEARHDEWDCRELRPGECYRVEAPGIEYACNALFTERPTHYADREFHLMLNRITSDEQVKPVVIVCGENGRENLEIAGILASSLEPLRKKPLPFYVWLPHQPSLYAAIDPADGRNTQTSSGMCKLYPFGDCRESASLDTLFDRAVERRAKKMYEAYLEKISPNYRGEAPDWEDALESERRWNISPAAHSIIKRDIASSINNDPAYPPFSDEVIEILAEIEHNRWTAERLIAGWRFDPKASDKPTTNHRPTLVPWNCSLLDKLGEKDKDRDQVLIALEIVIAAENLPTA